MQEGLSNLENNNRKEFRTYEPRMGEDVEGIATHMIELAKETSSSVKADLNGIILKAEANSTIEQICAEYEKKYEERRERIIENTNVVLNKLKDVSFQKYEDVIEWFYELGEMVIDNDKEVLGIFNDNGYKANSDVYGDNEEQRGFDEHLFDTNLEKTLQDPKSKEEAARYIIGQALDEIKNYGSMGMMVNDLIERFLLIVNSAKND